MVRVLIIGGFGFLGGRLAKHLFRTGYEVVLGTRNFRAPPACLPDAEVVAIRLDDFDKLVKIFDDVNVVIDAAGMNALECALDPAEALRVNGEVTKCLANAACQAGVEKFIYISTAHVYANPLIGTITEQTNPINLHPYATSHLCGEYAVLRMNQSGKMNAAVLRLSNVFGRPSDKSVNCWMLLVNELCKQAIEKNQLILKTSGMQQRNFIALSQFCWVVEQFLTNSTSFGPTGIYNVGTVKSYSILEVAKLIQKRCFEVLGYKPILKIANDAPIPLNTQLTYSVDKLSALGIKFNQFDFVAEIDDLLQFCKREFSRGNEFF
jgi:UDP-glucose 4-epimerase